MKKTSSDRPIPEKKVGIGLRSSHISRVLKNHKKISKKIGWFEVHSENYYQFESSSLAALKKVRENFPISLHSVGNSLGSAKKPDLKHLRKLKKLIEIIDPFLVSDHISWGYVGAQHLNDLLPLPYNQETLDLLTRNIEITQNFLGREILVENPSTYLSFKKQEFSEAEFVNKLCKKAGCFLLLDVNNIFVSSQNNQDFAPDNYLQEIEQKFVKEIHLAGHSKSEISDGKKQKEILIDTHNNLVCKEVWQLYKIAKNRFKNTPALIEWDQDIPPFTTLLAEAKRAEEI